MFRACETNGFQAHQQNPTEPTIRQLAIVWLLACPDVCSIS